MWSGIASILLLAVLALALIQVACFETYGTFTKDPFTITVPDLMIVQKLLLCFFFMIFLHRFVSVPLPALNRLATASFPVFFLHPWVLNGYCRLQSQYARYLGAIPGPILFLALTAMVVLTSLAITDAANGMARRIVPGWVRGVEGGA